MALGATPAYGLVNPSDSRGSSMSSEDLSVHCNGVEETTPRNHTENHNAEKSEVASAVGIECKTTNFFSRTITSAALTETEEIDGPQWAPKTEFASVAGATPDGVQVLSYCSELNIKRTRFSLALSGEGNLPTGFTKSDKGKLINTQMAGFTGLASSSNAAFKLELPAGDYVLDAVDDAGSIDDWRKWNMTIRTNIANADPTGQTPMIGPAGNAGAPWVATQILISELTSAKYTMTSRVVTLNADAPATISESLDEFDDVISNA